MPEPSGGDRPPKAATLPVGSSIIVACRHTLATALVSIALVALVAGCSSEPGTDRSAITTTTTTTTTPTTASPDGRSLLGTTPSASIEATAGTDSGPPADSVPALTIEVMNEPGGGLGDRWPLLATFGYYGRPATDIGYYDLPAFVLEAAADDDAHRPVGVELVELNWGIDSSGLLIAIDGPTEAVAEMASAFEPGPRWLIDGDGDGWLGVAYRGGLSANFELDELAAAIEWIMRPDQACGMAEAACPLGADVAFPPPPPELVVAELILGENARPTAGVDSGVRAASEVRVDSALPFEVEMLVEPVSRLATTDRVPTWIDAEGHVRSRWNPNDDEGTDRGSARVFHSIGSVLFAVNGRPGEPDRISLGYSHEESIITEWAAPEDWMVHGLAFIGTFGLDDYRLIVTADLDDGSSRTVALPVGTALLNGGIRAGEFLRDQTPVDLAMLPPLNPAGARWSDPQRSAGLLTVIEEREGQWVLIGDPLGRRLELLRANYPVLSYAVSPGAAHMVVTVDGPQGPSIHWAHHGEVEVIGHGPAALGWLGEHPAGAR